MRRLYPSHHFFSAPIYNAVATMFGGTQFTSDLTLIVVILCILLLAYGLNNLCGARRSKMKTLIMSTPLNQGAQPGLEVRNVIVPAASGSSSSGGTHMPPVGSY